MDFSAAMAYLYNLKMLTLFEHGNKPPDPVPGTAETPPLDPLDIPKFQSRLTVPETFYPLCFAGERLADGYVVDISRFRRQLLPSGFPATTVFGYGGFVKDPVTGYAVYRRSTPGPTFEARRGKRIYVKWINRLYGPHPLAVDPTLHWANPNGMPAEPPVPWPLFPPGFPLAQSPVPVVTHIHGGENPPGSDGWPENWFTYNDENSPVEANDMYIYPNCQQSATLWYHDHTLGITRLNLYAGLSGMYILRDPKRPMDDPGDNSQTVLPHGKYEIPLVIQDRSFFQDGTLAYPWAGNNPDIHPYWVPEFFGDTIMVNGTVWPTLKVERRKYRFRVLNGSNARFYHLFLPAAIPVFQIGTDGGYLEKPVEIKTLLLAPAERADILVDFSVCEPDIKIILRNDAKTPYPSGNAADPDTVGQILQFETEGSRAFKGYMPVKLNTIPHLVPDAPSRYFTLDEISGDGGSTSALLNNLHWSDPITEFPRVGSTEDWMIANLTVDTHPIHLHLVQFLLVSRQNFDMSAFKEARLRGSGQLPECFATGCEKPPDQNERGWKDTVRMNPGQITRIRMRFAPQGIPADAVRPGMNLYPFNPMEKPGYAWHCHILEHEDNDMMRPFRVIR